MRSHAREATRLLDFASASVHPGGGFSWLDARGRPDLGQGIHTWISARMTYVYALAALQHRADAAEIAAHGVASLQGGLRDSVHGGWYGAVSAETLEPVDDTKQAYAHAFVVLAAASSSVADVPGADELLDEALDVVSSRFLDRDGRVVDGYDRSFATADEYRGANSSMHMVEALLVAGDVQPGSQWHQVALGIAEHLIHRVARDHGCRLPEHFDADWVPLPDYNRDRPDDQFRPYGSTPGHLLEWSRLLLHLEAALPSPPDWLLEDARSIFDVAVRTGWYVDGDPGFVYTVDWDDHPVVRARMHWVHAEATAAASALHRRTGESRYEEWSRTWWGYIDRYLVDREHGSWHHELDPSNNPADLTWSGKPDVYHAFQSTLLPRMALAPSLPVQLARG